MNDKQYVVYWTNTRDFVRLSWSFLDERTASEFMQSLKDAKNVYDSVYVTRQTVEERRKTLSTWIENLMQCHVGSE